MVDKQTKEVTYPCPCLHKSYVSFHCHKQSLPPSNSPCDAAPGPGQYWIWGNRRDPGREKQLGEYSITEEDGDNMIKSDTDPEKIEFYRVLLS